MAEQITPRVERGDLVGIGSFWFQLRPHEEYKIRFHPYRTAFVVQLQDNEPGETPEVVLSQRGEDELVLSFSKLRSRANWGTLAPYAVGTFQEGGATFEIWLTYLVTPWVTGAHFHVALYTKEIDDRTVGNG